MDTSSPKQAHQSGNHVRRVRAPSTPLIISAAPRAVGAPEIAIPHPESGPGKQRKKQQKRLFGVAEWAEKKLNLYRGCSHDCRYCYARVFAVRRFHRVEPGAWATECLRAGDPLKQLGRPRPDGVMFPTTHDIVPATLEQCLRAIVRLLEKGWPLLVVTKPHLSCIQAICAEVLAMEERSGRPYRKQMILRFSIGCDDPALLSYWEPGAPSYAERMSCLQYAFEKGFQTSVSCEPMLDPVNLPRHVRALRPYVNETIWVGKMNNCAVSVRIECDADRVQLAKLQHAYRDEAMWQLFHELKDDPLIRWKDSLSKMFLPGGSADQAAHQAAG